MEGLKASAPEGASSPQLCGADVEMKVLEGMKCLDIRVIVDLILHALHILKIVACYGCVDFQYFNRLL